MLEILWAFFQFFWLLKLCQTAPFLDWLKEQVQNNCLEIMRKSKITSEHEIYLDEHDTESQYVMDHTSSYL